MRVANYALITVGTVISAAAFGRTEGVSGSWIGLVLSPYLALAVIEMIVNGKSASTAGRRACLVDSLAIVGVSAWLYIPIIVDPSGCMTSLVFLLSIPLLLAVPALFAVSRLALKLLD